MPVFGMCYGFQSMVQALGGTVSKTGLGEYGATPARITDVSSVLFNGQPDEQSVWMSHGDSVTEAPAGMRVTASTAGAPVAAFEDDERRLYGVQWHPEVMHSTFGQRVLENFLWRGAGIEGDWTAANVVDELVETIRAQVGESRVLCALRRRRLSVAAALVQKAVGDQLTCVFVDHGLLRAGEAEQVEKDFVAATGVDLVVVDARDRFLSALAGCPTRGEAQDHRPGVHPGLRAGGPRRRGLARGANDHPVEFLVQGTLYPDVVESGGAPARPTSSRTTTSAACRTTCSSSWSSRCGRCSRTRCARSGSSWACRRPSSGASPSRPGPRHPHRRRGHRRASGGAARGGRHRPSGADGSWPRPRHLAVPVVLLADVRSVGVQGDGRTYGHPVVLRPVSSEDAMTADWTRVPYDVLAKISTRITNEVREVNRVVLDVTSKPRGPSSGSEQIGLRVEVRS